MSAWTIRLSGRRWQREAGSLRIAGLALLAALLGYGSSALTNLLREDSPLRPIWPNLTLYLWQPLLFLAAAFVVLRQWRAATAAQGVTAPIERDRAQILTGAMLGGVQVVLLLLAGVFGGFGRSPYARAASGLALNLWTQLSMVFAIEIIRWRILNSHGRPRSTFSIVLAWLLPFALTLPLARLSELGNPEQAFSLAGSVIVPAAGQSLLATALSGLGGPFAALAYRAIPLIFEFASPVLPTLSWQIAAVLGVAVPLVGMFLTADLAEEQAEDDGETGRKGFSVSPADLVIVCVGVAVLWFNTGLLGVRPALISGHSMEPLLTTGDIVVCKNVSPAEVVVGDVIRFKSGDATVMHRVVEIQEDAQGRRTFITWGDNNNAIDQPVDESQVMGRAIFFLRKIGWLAIWPGQLLKGIFGR